MASTLRLVRAGRADMTVPGGGAFDDADELDPAALETRGDLDVGVLAIIGPVRVGATVKHLNEPEFRDNGLLLERQARAGVAWFVGQPGAAASLTAAFDVDLTRTPTHLGEVRHMAGGAELSLPRQMLALRAGMSANTIGDLTRSTSTGISVGLSRGFFLDAAATFGSDRSRKGWAVGLRLTI
jgi:hypothetical protein